MRHSTTLREIAQITGYSVSTISKALSLFRKFNPVEVTR